MAMVTREEGRVLHLVLRRSTGRRHGGLGERRAPRVRDGQGAACRGCCAGFGFFFKFLIACGIL
jgi:hypothetical protein